MIIVKNFILKSTQNRQNKFSLFHIKMKNKGKKYLFLTILENVTYDL